MRLEENRAKQTKFDRPWEDTNMTQTREERIETTGGLHFHDLLNDIDKEFVIKDILSWIDARLPATQKNTKR